MTTNGMRHLTPREKEILELACEGFSSREIGGKLMIAIKTVEAHRANVMRKTGCRNFAQLFRWAIQTKHVKV